MLDTPQKSASEKNISFQALQIRFPKYSQYLRLVSGKILQKFLKVNIRLKKFQKFFHKNFLSRFEKIKT